MDADAAPVPVGDRLWVILVAYLLVFLPWTAAQALDYIGPDWKSVNDTRRDGFLQFLITLIPISAITFYIPAQYRAADYKEMSAAILALAFALAHLAATWWGLWQLHHFSRWAALAIRLLRSQGTPYRILRDYTPPPPGCPDVPAWDAGQIKVNASIIDNNIFRGRARCYAVRAARPRRPRARRDWMHLRARPARRWYSRPVLVLQTAVVVLVSWLTNLLHFLATLCRLRKRHAPPSLWTLRPYDPVDLWINWAVAFAAQGLDDWIDAFDAAPLPAPADGTTTRGYRDRQAYFAKEVLASAVLLLPDRHFLFDEPDVRFGRGHPLLWGSGHAHQTAFQKVGKIDHKEMLYRAVLSGRNLPFDAPHATREPTGDSAIDTVSEDLQKSGYQSYDYDLKEAVGDMPSKFGNAIDKFTVNMLEALTIKLSLGVWEEKPRQKRRRHRRKTEHPAGSSSADADMESELHSLSNSSSPSKSRDFSSHHRPVVSSAESLRSINMHNGGESGLSEDSGPIQALRAQLGMTDDARPLVFEDEKGFSGLPFPLSQVGLGGVFRGNRAVLNVSAVIDNWVAFNAGDCLHQVVSHDPEWTQACLSLPTGRLDQTRPINAQHLLGRRSEIEKMHPEDNYLVYANDVLQRLQFTAQFGMADLSDLHLNQTVSFLGVIMEHVRSALAAGLPRQGRFNDSKRWTPVINFAEGSGLLTNPLEFELSESLTHALRTYKTECLSDSQDSVMTRPMEMRLLWELQNGFLGAIDESTSPDSTNAMVGCVLGFPALCFKSRVKSEVPRTVSFQLTRDSSGVAFIEREWHASIMPICAPQELYAAIAIVCRNAGDNARISVRLARRTTERDEIFDWEAWRDALNGRLRGLRKWQKLQGVTVLAECGTQTGITQGIERWKLPDPRTGSQLRVWAGWLPHRPNICRFEVSSEGIIRQYAISGIGVEQEGKPVSYASASQEDLTYSLRAVAERLFEVRRKELPTEPQGDLLENLPPIIMPVDLLVTQGKELLRKKKPDLRGALECFELAARNDNADGLQHAVDILIDKKSGQANLTKALFLTKHFGWMYGSRHSSVQERASVVEEIYQKLLEYSNCESKVVLGLSRFEIQRIERMEFNGSLNTCDVLNLLARSFRQTGQVKMVRQMVVIAAHCAWLRSQINPLGTGELLPVASWGSWIISTFCQRSGLDELYLGNETRNRTLREIFLYAAAKTMKDWRWLEDLLIRDDILFWMETDTLDEMCRKQDKHAPERNGCIIDLLYRAMRNKRDPEAIELLGDIYERGIAGVNANLAQAVEVYGEGAWQGDRFAIERLGTLIQRTDEKGLAVRHRILELLQDIASKGDAKAASVLGALYEGGLGGMEVNLEHAVELYGNGAIRMNGLSADRLGDIARMEGVQSQRVRPRVLEILRKAVEARNHKAAVVLGELYEKGSNGIDADLVQAVELYGTGLEDWESVPADRLGHIALREDGQAQILRPHILKMLYESLNKDGNPYAASVLRDLCQHGVDIWTSYEEEFVALLSQRGSHKSVVGLLADVATCNNSASLQVRPLIMNTLTEAAESGNTEAAWALGSVYEREDITQAVEIFGIASLQGHKSSTARLGKIALIAGDIVRARVMQLLHEASDLEYVHAVAVQATVLERDAENGNEGIYGVICLFAQAGHAGHEGSIVRLRNIGLRRFEGGRGNVAVEKLIDIAWRESCSEASETEALAAVGHVLQSVDCLNSTIVEAALDLFQDASARIYCHQYTSYHQLEVAFSAARGLAAIVQNSTIADGLRQRANVLLEEYVKLRREGPMEFVCASLVHRSKACHESILQAVGLYRELINMEESCSSQQFLRHEGKAELIGEAEIDAMRYIASLLETGSASIPQDRELATQLRFRYETLEVKMKEHRTHLEQIADILEYEGDCSCLSCQQEHLS